jgi:hypothetical protein
MLLLGLASLTAPAVADADQRNTRMAGLYEEICLKTFPDDKAIDALMTAKGAQPLSPEDVKVTLGDDPGRAWNLPDKSATIWLELPPYHACSVRWSSPQFGDLSRYREVADKYERKQGGFSTIEPFEGDAGPIHIHAVGEQRPLPDGGTESLFIFDQQISDQKRRDAGETGYVLRFVHQYRHPERNKVPRLPSAAN